MSLLSYQRLISFEFWAIQTFPRGENFLLDFLFLEMISLNSCTGLRILLSC